MRLYNTLTRRKEDFDLTPFIDTGKKIKIYMCGATVYNFIHIGNARPMVVFDTLRRYFEYKGCGVDFVTNYTDVDDKIIKKANDEGVGAETITARYIAEYESDAGKINFKEDGTIRPRATDNIGGIIEMVQKLIDKGFAYADGGEVFFEVGKCPDYGKLSGKNLDELEAGNRVEVDAKKRSPFDFVLWKPAKEGEPYWQSPWGNGRPGWHIECSVMAEKILGGTIDIHCGGEDLIFPHHENEIAQSECANGVPFARFWLHNGMVNVDNRKMSKSLNNFFLLREAGEKFGYETVRFFILSAHYRMPLNFGAETLSAAKSGLERIRNCVEKLKAVRERRALPYVLDLGRFRKDFEAVMEDDLNTANAVTAIFELVKFANVNADKDSAAAILKEITELCGILGLNIDVDDGGEDEFAERVAELLARRAELKRSKDFAGADAVRAELTEMGVEIKDTREGTTWTIKR